MKYYLIFIALLIISVGCFTSNRPTMGVPDGVIRKTVTLYQLRFNYRNCKLFFMEFQDTLRELPFLGSTCDNHCEWVFDEVKSKHGIEFLESVKLINSYTESHQDEAALTCVFKNSKDSLEAVVNKYILTAEFVVHSCKPFCSIFEGRSYNDLQYLVPISNIKIKTEIIKHETELDPFRFLDSRCYYGRCGIE